MNLNILKCNYKIQDGFTNSNFEHLISEPIENGNKPKYFTKDRINAFKFTDNKIKSMNKNLTFIIVDKKIKYIADIKIKRSDDIEYRNNTYNYLYIFKKVYIIPDNYTLFESFNKDNLFLDDCRSNHCELNYNNNITDTNKKYLDMYNKYILGLLPLFKCIEY